MKLKKAYAQEFTDHLNSIDDDIKWTTEGEVETHSEHNNTERALGFPGHVVRDQWGWYHKDESLQKGHAHRPVPQL